MISNLEVKRQLYVRQSSLFKNLLSSSILSQRVTETNSITLNLGSPLHIPMILFFFFFFSIGLMA